MSKIFDFDDGKKFFLALIAKSALVRWFHTTFSKNPLLKCPRANWSSSVLYGLGVNSFEHVLDCYKQASDSLTDIISAFEFLDRSCFETSCRMHNIAPPLETFPFYVLMEISGWTPDAEAARLEALLEKMMDSGLVVDGVTADEPSKIQVRGKVLRVWTGAFRWRVGGGKFCLRFSVGCAFCPCGLPLFQLRDFALYTRISNQTQNHLQYCFQLNLFKDSKNSISDILGHSWGCGWSVDSSRLCVQVRSFHPKAQHVSTGRGTKTSFNMKKFHFYSFWC